MNLVCKSSCTQELSCTSHPPPNREQNWASWLSDPTRPKGCTGQAWGMAGRVRRTWTKSPLALSTRSAQLRAELLISISQCPLVLYTPYASIKRKPFAQATYDWLCSAEPIFWWAWNPSAGSELRGATSPVKCACMHAQWNLTFGRTKMCKRQHCKQLIEAK